jgi:N-acyl-L-homoserine lactone synthetase
MFVTSKPSQEQLNEYYKLRHESFSQRLNMVNYHHEADAIDKKATTLLVIDDKAQCIAGAQLCFRMSKRDLLTPFEQKNRELIHLPYPYAEMLRFAIKLDYHPKNPVMELLFFECADYLYQANCKSLFFYTSRGHGVLYNRIFRKMNITLVADPELNKTLDQLFEGTVSVLYTCDLETYKR